MERSDVPFLFEWSVMVVEVESVDIVCVQSDFEHPPTLTPPHVKFINPFRSTTEGENLL